jgi:hypothetical protein
LGKISPAIAKECEMKQISIEPSLAGRSRFLVHGLIISVALNLGLLATFMTFILKEKKLETLLHASPSQQSGGAFQELKWKNRDVLKEYETCSFTDLIYELGSDELVEQGYRRRDLALAFLTTYHHFDLRRALPGVEVQKRPFIYSDQREKIDLIPGLDQNSFEMVIYFARFEKWPLTSQGLFEEMKHRCHDIPDSLAETFFLSKEFYQLEKAFHQFPFAFSRESLLDLLLEGDWEVVEEAISQIQEDPSREIGSIAPFLARFPESKLAAYLLIAAYPDYPYTYFSHERIEQLIGHLDERTEDAEQFLKKVIDSLRPDEIRQLAEKQLTSWKEVSSEPELHYQVKRGDSLWGVSRQFGVPMKMLREANGLNSDTLNPGQILRIPQK